MKNQVWKLSSFANLNFLVGRYKKRLVSCLLFSFLLHRSSSRRSLPVTIWISNLLASSTPIMMNSLDPIFLMTEPMKYTFLLRAIYLPPFLSFLQAGRTIYTKPRRYEYGWCMTAPQRQQLVPRQVKKNFEKPTNIQDGIKKEPSIACSINTNNPRVSWFRAIESRD